jgi:hypothetical protein
LSEMIMDESDFHLFYYRIIHPIPPDDV